MKRYMMILAFSANRSILRYLFIARDLLVGFYHLNQINGLSADPSAGYSKINMLRQYLISTLCSTRPIDFHVG